MTIFPKSIRNILSTCALGTLLVTVSVAFAQAPPSQAKWRIPATQALPASVELPAPIPQNAHTETPPQAGLINLNTATATELTELPGVGPKKASRIVQWRAKHGAFKRVADLRRVKGFGRKSVSKLRPYVSVGEATTKD